MAEEQNKSKSNLEPREEKGEDSIEEPREMDVDVEGETVNFKTINVDGKDQYQFEGCGKLSLSQQGIKSHITRTHKGGQTSPAKKRKERTPEKVTEKKKTKPSEAEEEYTFNFDDFAEFETSSQKGVQILEDFDATYSQGMEGQNPSESILAALDRSENTFEEGNKTIVEVVANPSSESINTAVETIRVLKMENEAVNKLLKNRDQEIKLKMEMVKLLQAEKNSLEDELRNKEATIREQNERIMDLEVREIDQKANYQRMGELCTSMKENKTKPAAKNDELVNKVKKVQAQITNVSKELEEEKKKNKNLEKELASESKLKNQFEVENARNLGMVTVLKDMLEKGQQSSRGMEKKKVKCRDFEKFGSCKRAESCAFLHPSITCQSFLTTGCKSNQCTDSHYVAGRSSPSKENKADCSYWLDGHCRYSVERCGRCHDPAKKGSKRQDFQSRSSGLEQSLSQSQLEQIASYMKGGQNQQNISQDCQIPAFRQNASLQPAIPQQQVLGAPHQPAFGGQQQVPGCGGKQQVPQQPTINQQNQQQPILTMQQQQQVAQLMQQCRGSQMVDQMTIQGAGESWPTIQLAGWTGAPQPGTRGPNGWM